MIEISGKITTGNYSFAGHPTKPGSPEEISLTGNTELAGGNGILSYINHNDFSLILSGGNWRRVRIRRDSSKEWEILDPGNLPPNVTVLGGAYWDKDHVWQRKETLPLAAEILSAISAASGADGLEAWAFTVKTLIDNPSINETAWNATQAAWAQKTGEFSGREGPENMIEPGAALNRILEAFFPGGDFETIAEEVRKYNYGVWAGAAEILTESYD